jgi:hypothetical protein
LGSVDDLVRRARRRWISIVLQNQAELAGCAALAALIVVLLAGTDLLSWRWIVAVVGAGVLAGAWRLRRQIPAPYSVAQAIDHRLEFPDSLSTAYYYKHLAGAKGSPALKALQLAEADAIARTVPVQKAIPYSSPRSLYALAALGLAASGLLAVRYGISHRLDLRPPLAMMVLDVFHFTKAEPVAQKQKTDRRTRELLNQFGLSLDAEQAQRGQGQQDQNAPGAPSETAELSEKGESGKAGQAGAGEQSGEQQEGDQDSAGVSIPQAGEEGRQTGEQQPGASQQASNGKQGQGNSPENNSLLSKFRDALSNLMSRLKPRPQGDQAQQFASAGQGKSDSGKGSETQDQQGSERASNGDSKGMPGSQGQSEQQGEGTQQASEGGQGGQGGRDSDQASREGRSGMGKEDGSKDIREAEQLAAMGKISEILGKRSQNLTGEVMVEVTSSKQQLKTAYSQQNAAHADAGGEIHRDEVPPAYQRFVRQYFEEIRKAPPIKPAEPAAGAARP